MKIKVFTRYFPPDFVGGAEVSTYYVAEALKDKFDLEINTLSSVISDTLNINKLNRPNPFWEVFPALYSARLKKKNNIKSSGNLIWNADFFGAIATHELQTPKILTIRDYWPICPCEMNLLKNHSHCMGCTFKNQLNCLKIKQSTFLRKIIRIIKYSLYNKFNQKLIAKADHVVFISNYIAKKVTDRIPLNNYSVIYNPLNEEYITKSLNKKINKTIVIVGKVDEYKGIDVLLNAMPAILKKYNDIKVIIAGAGNINKYQKKASELKVGQNVKFMGKVSICRMIELYDQADILVAPSLWPEPFGRTIIEGMARQCVPIASKHGGPAEIIKHGETGFLFDAGEHEQLAGFVLSLYKDEKKLKAMQKRARLDSIGRFRPSVIAKKYEELFMQELQS